MISSVQSVKLYNAQPPLQPKGAEWGLPLAGLKVEDEHGQHGEAGVLDLRQLEPLQLVHVGNVDAVLEGAGEGEGVEELAAGVALLAGGVGEVAGGARPGSGPLHRLGIGVEEVDPPLALYPAHQEQLRAEESPEGEGGDGAWVGAGLEPWDAAPGLADEDADHGCHRPPAVDQLRFSVPLEERWVLAQPQRVEPIVAGQTSIHSFTVE